MARQKLEYGLMVEAALRTVVRDVLEKLARDEIADPHHYYVTFRTGHHEVSMPDFLFARYPREMTIVLQHQYWDLEACENGFYVTLSFNDNPERLYVPYEAIKVFADPGVEFGLQFTLGNDMEDEGDERPSAPAEAVQLSTRSRSGSDEAAAQDDEKEPGEGAEIVTLDRFRKK